MAGLTTLADLQKRNLAAQGVKSETVPEAAPEVVPAKPPVEPLVKASVEAPVEAQAQPEVEPTPVSDSSAEPVSKQKPQKSQKPRESGDKVADKADNKSGSTSASNNLKTSLHENKFSSEQENLDTRKHVNMKTSLHVNNVLNEASGDGALQAELLGELSGMVKAPLINHACRAPKPLVEAADAYMAENWRLKVKKQDLMARALALLTYEMRTGKPLIILGNEAALGLQESLEESLGESSE